MDLFDRKGNKIPLLEWAALGEDPFYRIVRRDELLGGAQCLSTIWTGLPSIEYVLKDMHPEWGLEPLIFETMRFRMKDGLFRGVLEFPNPESDDLITQLKYASEEAAIKGHMEILARIRETEMS